MVRQLEEAAIAWKVLPFELLVAGAQLVLYRYTDQERLLTRVASRASGTPQTHGADIEADLTQDPSVRQHVDHVHRQLRTLSQPRSAPSRGVANDAPTSWPGSVGQTRVRLSEHAGTDQAARVPPWPHRADDLDIAFVIRPAEITCVWASHGGHIASADMVSMAQQLPVLLEAMLSTPDAKARTVPLLSQDDLGKIVGAWNETDHPLPATPTVHGLFAQRARETPHRRALTCAGQHQTYGELDRRSSVIARHLQQLGVRPGAMVGVCQSRGMDLIATLLAILKVGAAYVPLDPSYPTWRLRYMVEDAGLSLVVTEPSLVATVDLGGCTVVELTTEGIRGIDGVGFDDDIEVNADGSATAYVNYTSGSTGKPKGVAISHRNIVRLVYGDNCVRLDDSVVMLHHATICFDAATFEIWGPLLHGGTCVIFAASFPTLNRFGRCIREHGVTTMFLTAALFNTIVDDDPAILSPARQVLAGGEALSAKHVRRALEVLPNTEIINGYGPTESTTFATYHAIKHVPADARTVPIGSPLSNTQCYVLDSNRQLTPIGVVGELYLGGQGLANGYLNRPQLTAQRFRRGFDFLPGDERLYRTGDMARQLPDGRIDVLGRADAQVKIHGFRIELGEIESALRDDPDVRTAAVVVSEHETLGRTLIAYVEASSGYDSQAMNRRLSGRLPRYMLPSRYVTVRALPVTHNGKVDRRALASGDFTTRI
ncbi:MAG: amino acid adenylation domain-containing protein [Deltaproteobacteria bacterium]|nr:amino acid adenylation domain-containing protein [Deltaproteobacteria bacterium]